MWSLAVWGGIMSKSREVYCERMWYQSPSGTGSHCTAHSWAQSSKIVDQSSCRMYRQYVVPTFCPKGCTALYTLCLISLWPRWLAVNVQWCWGECQVTESTWKSFQKPWMLIGASLSQRRLSGCSVIGKSEGLTRLVTPFPLFLCLSFS